MIVLIKQFHSLSRKITVVLIMPVSNALNRTLEDVMQASVPGIIENVRVAEIDQGNNPIRILSIRSLPDEHVEDLKRNAKEENRKHKDPEAAAADSEGGEYYNFEVSFAYHAEPSGPSASAKARNMHMHLVFYLGVKGLFGVPFPVFAELMELVGTVRLRLQMTPEPPFAKSLTFSLMGLPHVQAGCVPLVKKGVNILNLPLISNFVNSAIGSKKKNKRDVQTSYTPNGRAQRRGTGERGGGREERRGCKSKRVQGQGTG
ncbi:hypothetical protein VTN31DRAFT_5974 [Thermomyces dupontii]|uniref:uncharacterized protein n=1 Tax=Talaromyces thermophilus TaxID=28565 RepID=UPI00374267FE